MYKDQGQTDNQIGEAIKNITQTCEVIKTVYQKYITTSVREGYAPPVWKWAQVQGIKEHRLTIKGGEDWGIVSSEEVYTSLVV